MNKPSPFGQWLRQARLRAKLSQSALGRRAQLHRLQIAYLENGRTALPRSDARERLFTALGQYAPQEAITHSTRAGLRDVHCSFCGATDDDTWFMATSPLRPGVGICAYCLMSAHQQASRAAREQANAEAESVTDVEHMGDW